MAWKGRKNGGERPLNTVSKILYGTVWRNTFQITFLFLITYSVLRNKIRPKLRHFGREIKVNACSRTLFVVVPSALFNGGILSNAEGPLGTRYLAACQTLALSARKSCQCVFFCFRIAVWYVLAASFACNFKFGSARPDRLRDRAWLL